jgi:IclR family pca regulon transcriptional regulator
MNRSEIQGRLADVRTHGYALRDSYFGSGLRVLAVPVLDSDKYPLASISVAVPQMQLSTEDFRKLALGAVRRAAADMAKAVQASGTIFAAV